VRGEFDDDWELPQAVAFPSERDGLVGPESFTLWSQWAKYAHNYLSFPFALGVVLIFLMVSSAGSVLVAMVNNKPMVSALAIALMSAPLAAMGGAAVLHGLYFCDRVSRCLVGLIPY